MGRWGRGRVLGLGAGALVAGAVLVAALGRTDGAPTGDPQERPPPTTPAPSPSAGPTPLLPNMRSLEAFDLDVVRTPGGRELRFAAALANLGPGPLLLRPLAAGATCPAGQHPATQLVFRDVGADATYHPLRERPLRRQPVGCMLEHPDHDHWHFDAMAAYALRDPATGATLAERRKVSFCLRDNRRVSGVATRVRREHFGECSRTARQGISPGWVDVYSADLAGQSLPLPPGAGRRALCLDLTADPRGRIEEADETDNAVSTGIVVRGPDARFAPGVRCS
ncbi:MULTISPECIES: lysyl oxidase family protein [unclassified Nocardioides]|uniref:lysyl oxidase family protein n=1 Tax=unclassified Nocardioides TaxID=2615069 RepID=UPI0036075210